ncbi:MAG: hypothetical protein ACFFB2_15550, partial [Promethearchaeota archaeon]
FVTLGSSRPTLPTYQAFDIGPKLREIGVSDVALNLETEFSSSFGGMGASISSYNEGDIVWSLWYDDMTGLWLKPYIVGAIGTVGEVWVDPDLDWPDPSDPRPVPVITQENINFILSEFENNIYPKTTSYFGEPEFHTGENSVLAAMLGLPSDYYFDATGRTIIMISNIGDENYYDSDYPIYIAGFYWGTYEYYFDRNIVNIDAWNFQSKPSTLAHEMQHLIHADYNSLDATFMNEGCSTFTEWLCGYGVPWGDIEWYLTTPDNSLIEWGDQGGINILADYGVVFLWAMYLNDHFGTEFLGNFVRTGIPGIDGLNSALFPKSFDEIYHDWRIANLIHSDNPGGGKYNYKTIDLSEAEVEARVYDVTPGETPIKGTDFGVTRSILDDSTKMYMVSSYGTDYVRLTGFTEDDDVLFLFDGDNVANLAPQWRRVDEENDGNDDLEWWSTLAGNLADLSIVTEVTLPDTETVTLSFDTYYQIETYWDFGFVQISNDGGETWSSLANDYTTSLYESGAHPDIVSNLPGLTGWSVDWMSMDFDLSDYSGETVLIRFRYMTDWYTVFDGFYVDNIAINGETIDNADTVVTFSPLEPPMYVDTDFVVTLIKVQMKRGVPKYRHIKTFKINHYTETFAKMINGFVDGSDYVLLIVSPTQGPADYQFTISYK